jgi:hypothetical protein
MAGTSEECQGLEHLDVRLKVVSGEVLYGIVEIFADLLLPIPYFHSTAQKIKKIHRVKYTTYLEFV